MPIRPMVALCVTLERSHCASFGAVPRALAPHCDHGCGISVCCHARAKSEDTPCKQALHLPGARVYSEPDIGIAWGIVGGGWGPPNSW